MRKFKEYLEYRKNKKIAKKELAKIAATTLPLVSELSVKGKDVINFVVKLSTDTKEVGGEKILEMVISELADVLKTNNERVVEILSYMSSMTPQDIQKVLVHSTVATMQKDE